MHQSLGFRLALSFILAMAALLPIARVGAQTGDGRVAVQTLPSNVYNQYVINAPGSYYLNANIVGVANKNGIGVNANNVTIDLNGFTMFGGAAGADAVAQGAALAHVVVKNGTIRDWNGRGVSLGDSESCSVERIVAFGNGGAGIRVGKFGRVTLCTATGNGTLSGTVYGHGIEVGDASTVSGCSAGGNLGHGIYSWVPGSASTHESHGVITGCTAVANGSSGIKVESGSTITDCGSSRHASTGSHGFDVLDGCTLRGCTALQNAGSGITGGSLCVVTHCSASRNGFDGINLQDDSVVENSTSDMNAGNGVRLRNNDVVRGVASSSNNGVGIEVLARGVIEGCSASQNKEDGIEIYGFTQVNGCVAAMNVGNGIFVQQSYNTLVQNDCHMNKSGKPDDQSAGIRLGGETQASDNRIDNNHLTQNDIGLHVFSPLPAYTARNVIVRNSGVNNRFNADIFSIDDFRNFWYSESNGSNYRLDSVYLGDRLDHTGDVIGMILKMPNGGLIDLSVDPNLDTSDPGFCHLFVPSARVRMNYGNPWANIEIALPNSGFPCP